VNELKECLVASDKNILGEIASRLSRVSTGENVVRALGTIVAILDRELSEDDVDLDQSESMDVG
jgi:hypothetical protein